MVWKEGDSVFQYALSGDMKHEAWFKEPGIDDFTNGLDETVAFWLSVEGATY